MFPFNPEIAVNPKANPDLVVHYQDVHDFIGSLLTPERRAKIDQVAQNRNFSNCVVLENIYDRGNASAVMRSGEALGFVNFHLIELGEKFKESQRTTAGADKWIEVTKWKSTSACVQALKRQGYRIVVTHLSESSKPIQQVDFSQPTALVLGNEKEGASPEMIASADDLVILPMTGFVQSYNISVAAALCLYHQFQDRHRRVGLTPDLNSEQIAILQAKYYLRSLDSAEDILGQLKVRKKLRPLIHVT